MAIDRGRLAAAGIAAGAALWGGAAAAQDQCGAFPVGQESYVCACPAGFATGSVWGSGPYTADSNVCSAALHAGAIGPQGGKVLAVAAEGLQSYTGSEVNGVASRDWGSYPNSFYFENASAAGVEACGPFPTDAETYTCSCDAEAIAGGFVWGSSPYTADSDICAAAVHGGLIDVDGGVVTAVRTAGLEAYAASEFNGVSTGAWGSYPESFVLDYNE